MLRQEVRVDLIFLRGLAAEVRVGVPDWERARPQTLNFSIELAIDAAVAAVDDDLAATIDYAAVLTKIIQDMVTEEMPGVDTSAMEFDEFLNFAAGMFNPGGDGTTSGG